LPDLFPTTEILPETITTTAGQIKFGKSWRFDFNEGDFVIISIGKMAETTGIDAYIEWCKKALQTPRYRYLVYGRNYGQEFKSLIGKGYSRLVIESEIRRMTSECLMVDPRTAKVDNFIFTWGGDKVYFTCNVTTVRGEAGIVRSEVTI